MALTYKEVDKFIAAFLAMRDGISDALTSVAVDVYPELNEDGELIKAGTRIKWNGALYKSLLNANTYTPDAYPAGWEVVK